MHSVLGTSGMSIATYLHSTRYPESLLSLSTLTRAHQLCPDPRTAHTVKQLSQTLTNRWWQVSGLRDVVMIG